MPLNPAYRLMPTEAFNRALGVVCTERGLAIRKHGPLKPGADRWMRLLGEEWREVQDELAFMMVPSGGLIDADRAIALSACRRDAISELAQLAQLCIGVIELLQAEESDAKI